MEGSDWDTNLAAIWTFALRLRKVTETCKDSRCPGRGLNHMPSQFKTVALKLQPTSMDYSL
jgi:hypothetical protein